MKNPTSKSQVYLNEELSHEYFLWLRSLITDDEHNTLIRHLHRRPFEWIIDNDDNRAYDGIALRDMFVDQTQYNQREYPEGDCSILEMLIGVAIRINDILIETEGEEKIACWFWEIIGNLGLIKFTDDCLFELGGLIKIDQILDRFLGRKYNRNGEGGLFPLKNPEVDQRDVEIWYQMSEYLVENYSEED